MSVQFITSAQAAALIPDNAHVVVDGFFGYSLAEDILVEMEKRYQAVRHPAGMHLKFITDPTIDGELRGINRLAYDGMIASAIGSNMTHAKKLADRAGRNEFPIWMLPQGVILEMWRAIAAGRPGVLTDVGLHTYADPRLEGCAMNEAAKEDGGYRIEVVKIGGEEYLFYPRFPIEYVLLKGSYADEDGNVSIEREGVRIQQLELAMAAHNTGGKVIVQVDQLLLRNSIRPRDVAIPRDMIDYICVGDPEHSRQQFVWPDHFKPELSGDIRVVLESIKPMPFGVRKLLARRAAMELFKGDFTNLGIGVPTHVSDILAEEGLFDQITLSFESGIVGGLPASGFAAGSGFNASAILRHTDMFNFIDGGGIDLTCLGCAQVDREGNVNVTKFGGRITGPGGFVDISQNARTVCFVGTFTAGKPEVKIKPDGSLEVVSEGSLMKFIDHVDQVSFSGEYARQRGRRVLYVTERAVFEMRPGGITLTEIAPGIDLERDILAHMAFRPQIAADLHEMDRRIFLDQPMGLSLKDR